MKPLSQLTKAKSRRYLVLSAGGQQSGIQGLYIQKETASWSILSQAFLPYPSSVQSLLETLAQSCETAAALQSIGRLDHAVSNLFLECARTVCAGAQKSLRQPHAVLVNKLGIWRGAVEDLDPKRIWNIELGDCFLLASQLKTPVLSDFSRHDILRGGTGTLPLYPGMCEIVVENEGITAHLTIGMLSHLFMVDMPAQHTIIDADIAPGAGLINYAAKNALCSEGFDRDGSCSAQGNVDGRCLEALVSLPCFSASSPAQLGPEALKTLLDHPCIATLTPMDKLATVTALIARLIFNYYKREYNHVIAPQTLWVSGGGANNATLIEFLQTFFAPMRLRRIDELGIPAEMFVPLALGLTVDAFLMGRDGPWKSLRTIDEYRIGTWLAP